MTRIYDPATQTKFYASSRYPQSNEETYAMGLTGSRNEEMRAMTIAAIRVTQNDTDIDDRMMDSDLLYFLAGGSDSAIRHWKKMGRLTDGEGGMYLESEGLSECANSLEGRSRGYNVSEDKVHEWVHRMLSSDQVTTKVYEIRRSSQEQTPSGHIDEHVLSSILSRRGQPKFRVKMLAAYDGKCAITNCTAESALEAAHITPHSQAQSYEVNNGILLRADIHTLFDLFLISIDPEDGTVLVSEECKPSYDKYHGIKLSLPSSHADWPHPSSLMVHYLKWKERNGN
jgi:hypothetical protein